MAALWRDRLILSAPLLAVFALISVSPGAVGPTICPFALFTGTACPGCGMTRAGSALLRGDLQTAMTLHPLVVLIAFQLAAGWVWYLLRRTGRVKPLSNRALNLFLILTGTALLAVWVVRVLSGSLPPV